MSGFGVAISVTRTETVRRSAAACALVHAVFLAVLMLLTVPAFAQQKATLTAEDMQGYARLILTFDGRLNLPEYKLNSKNGVLALELTDPVEITIPKLDETLPKYVAVARLDPDQRGLRIGLQGDFRINSMEAGEKLFIDILPSDWQGILPGLPAGVVEELTRRTMLAAQEAERRRKLEIARSDAPTVTLRVGRHPTFTRMQFDWTADTQADFKSKDGLSVLNFDWPIDVDLFPLMSDKPEEVLSATNTVSDKGSKIVLKTKGNVQPRFYATSRRQFIIDIDRPGGAPDGVDIASLLPDQQQVAEKTVQDTAKAQKEAAQAVAESGQKQTDLVPRIENVGSTLRLVFPFAEDTPAAVFRRGDTLWMLFDTAVNIKAPQATPDWQQIASDFSVTPTGDTAVVSIRLRSNRLASLGSEGRAWVLSLGDVLLSPTTPMTLARQQNDNGEFSIVADMQRPSRVHELRDPEVGDVLEVVTAYPPARGLIREQDYVDFNALHSVHGLVVKALHPGVTVNIEDTTARISAERGLVVSAPEAGHANDSLEAARMRDGFIDLVSYEEPSHGKYVERQKEILQRIATSQNRLQDAARLELGRFYLANQFSYEAVGATKYMLESSTSSDFKDQARLLLAAADVAAGRSKDALDILGQEDMASRVDALMWRAMARTQANDFAGARLDALSAEPVIDTYPAWVREKFLLDGIEAGIETGDNELASRFYTQVDTKELNRDEASRYELLAGRLDEVEKRYDEALDTYGQVITADIRPTRAEAVYLTVKLLDRMGRLDPKKGAETLGAEATVWRGDALEAKMQKLLAELFFRSNNFREGFETVQAAAKAHPDDPSVDKLLEEARQVFASLYLDGRADTMEPIEAMTLYYDFQQLTPAGARGDEMIRNLARRLIGVDLLDQAAALLEYQVKNRLDGAAKAQIAADLAVIYIANRQPDKALRALSGSRLAGLPPALDRQRRLLEARALIDADRGELALDLLSSMDGRDADLLRVDAHWKNKRYWEAAQLLEKLYTPDSPDAKLTPQARAGVVRAAVGFVLSNDKIGLSRLRQKFAGAMSDAPEWGMFDFVTGPIEANSLQFRKVAQEVASIDSLNAFLSSYKQTYGPDGALSPQKARTQAKL